MRTHHCGSLREEHLGQTVTLCGWANVVRDQSHQMFIDLRDRSGLVQCVIDRDQNTALHESLRGVKTEFCLKIEGVVAARPAGTANAKLPTGQVEIHVSAVEILNASKTPPFELTDDIKADENLRIQYRYLDLRRQLMQRNLKMRHKAMLEVRNFLDGEGFWEVETPLLWKSTPEGAREYVVPVRQPVGKAF